MREYVIDLRREARKNTDFHRVLYTGKHIQLAVMSLKPGEEIGEETHDRTDQYFRFEAGEGAIVIEGSEQRVGEGVGVIIPAGVRHNVINTSKRAHLKLYTILSQPARHNGIVRHIKNRYTTEKHRFPEPLMEGIRKAYRSSLQET
ncbi:MAG: cupin domain-containing protein [Candidatus Bathyarchaeia archaeon]